MPLVTLSHLASVASRAEPNLVRSSSLSWGGVEVKLDAGDHGQGKQERRLLVYVGKVVEVVVRREEPLDEELGVLDVVGIGSSFRRASGH